jgi:molybdopterin synthase catalytic subunit
MQIRVRLFALASQLVGARQLEVDVDETADVAALRDALFAQHPALRALENHALLAVNAEYADDMTPVSQDAEVALIPPVSGG